MDSAPEIGPEGINNLFAEAPDIDGTTLIVQRHEEYVRDPNSPLRGSLTPESAEKGRVQSTEVLKGILDQIPESERGLLDVMVVASPTQYLEGGQRSMETAAEVLAGIKQVFEEYNLSPNQVLNNNARLKLGGRPIQSKSVVEPKIFTENPDFVEFLKQEKYGNGAINSGFFKAYEEDEGEVKEARLAMGAEGPEDMANRLNNYLYALKRYSEKYHNNNPGRRLIVWTVSHYDTISPFVKSRIGGGKNGYLGIDYGSGIAINLKPDGSSSAKIGGKDYLLSLVKASTASSIE